MQCTACTSAHHWHYFHGSLYSRKKRWKSIQRGFLFVVGLWYFGFHSIFWTAFMCLRKALNYDSHFSKVEFKIPFLSPPCLGSLSINTHTHTYTHTHMGPWQNQSRSSTFLFINDQCGTQHLTLSLFTSSPGFDFHFGPLLTTQSLCHVRLWLEDGQLWTRKWGPHQTPNLPGLPSLQKCEK